MGIISFFKETNRNHHTQLFCKLLHPRQETNAEISLTKKASISIRSRVNLCPSDKGSEMDGV